MTTDDIEKIYQPLCAILIKAIVKNVMQKDLAKELEVFGFTLNQAKVYLAIVQAGSASVGEIAELSKVYRQDIYKILPKLEKKGVTTQTLGKPIILKAVPVKKALKNIVSRERVTMLERIARMEARLPEFLNAISEVYEKRTGSEKQEPYFSLLTKDNEISNRADLLYEKAKTECNIALSIELMDMRGPNFHNRFRTAINNGAKVRLLIEAPRMVEQIGSIVERVRPDSANFTAKLRISESPKPFQIIDREEVWISTKLKSESGVPCVLWSNGKNIVSTYQELFERLWKSMKAVTLARFPIAKAKEHSREREKITNL